MILEELRDKIAGAEAIRDEAEEAVGEVAGVVEAEVVSDRGRDDGE